MGQTRLAENTRRWNEMKIKPSFWPAAQKFAQRALVHKDSYIRIAEMVKAKGYYVPWWFIPLVHERECVRGVDNWNCNIAQGCRFNVKCDVIPYNGPFSSFEEAALAALITEHPYAAKNTNWSGGGTMTIAESYNGTGYFRMGKTNPYLFSGTDQYIKGKYVADGKYDPNHVDTQLGVAISLKALMEADKSIQLDGNLPGQEKAPSGIEKGSSATLASTVLGWINMNPWYTLDWTDIGLIIGGTIVVAGIIVAGVKAWRRHYDK